jgi:hypothetical protein
MKSRLSFCLAVAAVVTWSSAAWAGSATVDGKVGGVGDSYSHTFSVTGVSGAPGTATLYMTQDASNNLYIALVLPRNYCDTTYGGNPAGSTTYTSSAWINAGKNHNFSDLDSSDQAVFTFARNGTTFFAGDMDYLEPTGSGNLTVVGSAGFTGGEGQVTTGQASMILSAQTSMGYNWSKFGYNMLDPDHDGDTTDAGETDKGFNIVDHSPTITEGTYNVVDADFADWQFDIVYEFSIAASALGNVQVLGANGFINGFTMTVNSVHASPNTASGAYSGTPTYTTSIAVPLHPAVWMGGVMMVLLAAHQVLRRRRAALTL